MRFATELATVLGLSGACCAFHVPTTMVAGPKQALLETFGASTARKPDDVLAAPVTLSPVVQETRIYGAVESRTITSSDGKKFPYNGVYADFVERGPWTAFSGDAAVQEGTFQSPLTSFLYERGWRQNFESNGFPGPDKEFQEAAEFFGPADVLVDISCGSGLMTRRFVKSNQFRRVLGMDLSAAMLGETALRFRRERLPKPELVRADVMKLPLATGSVDAVHAGAAIHCWVEVEAALSEIRRSLKRGGKFYATTFLPGAFLSRSTNSSRGMFKFRSKEELERLLQEARFTDIEVRQNGRACAIIRAKAPE